MHGCFSRRASGRCATVHACIYAYMYILRTYTHIHIRWARGARRVSLPDEHHEHDALHAEVVIPPQRDKIRPAIGVVREAIPAAYPPPTRGRPPYVDQLDELGRVVVAAHHEPPQRRRGRGIAHGRRLPNGTHLSHISSNARGVSRRTCAHALLQRRVHPSHINAALQRRIYVVGSCLLWMRGASVWGIAKV